MKFPTYLFGMAALALVASCQEEIDLELPDGETRIIINGAVSNLEPAYALIKWTQPYLSGVENQPVMGAEAYVYEDGVVADTLVDMGDGLYQGDLLGQQGKAYHIAVTVSNADEGHPNGTWLSHDETMGRCLPIDTMYSLELPDAPFQPAGHYVYAHWREAPGEGDIYRIRQWYDDSLANMPYNIQVFDDGFIDGIGFGTDIDPFEVARAQEGGVKIEFELSSISLGLQAYLQLIQDQTLRAGSLFSPPPAPIVGNIFHEDDENDWALGYFYSTWRQRAVVVTPQ